MRVQFGFILCLPCGCFGMCSYQIRVSFSLYSCQLYAEFVTASCQFRQFRCNFVTVRICVVPNLCPFRINCMRIALQFPVKVVSVSCQVPCSFRYNFVLVACPFRVKFLVFRNTRCAHEGNDGSDELPQRNLSLFRKT